MKKTFLILALVTIPFCPPSLSGQGITVKNWSTPDFSAFPKDSQGRPYIDGQVLVHFDKSMPEPSRENLRVPTLMPSARDASQAC